ncbi:2TM domain-containing protein [Dolichospermum circinale CS-1225]|uniref:2TM domain-containing protein n=1 Tax=Dolichospermum circinale CS-537/01 TaxID=3021739 RepID=A0ABT5A260_9CYAN|nr:2TM domain-containing protein [Dolichospermum circinale]MDB9457735.1 2TM domain-containing protein [Dolichospermum circinale CS-545/17]MDB9467575.1 2TM domain-containing protein [Dolichospermum circinale CS-539/09]MDB9472764.1 2TM domain-containing protein [Dolichospermum circinale CS-539]MDB9486021.1 2TM domain-containing protein [Dolichospermum circinale CS-537/01]MDB9523321.1 2TM domain-containing protein [Dolichospermum circinale CS-1225]
MTQFNSHTLRSYTQEDVQQILQLAISRQVNDNNQEFSYQQILEIAKELQISPDNLQQAERDWLVKQSEVEQRQAFNLYRRSKFKKRLGNYAIINIFFLAMDSLSGGLSWSLYILVASALGISLDIWNTFQTKGEDYEIAFQRWNRNHQIKQTINTVLNKWFKVFSP